MCENTYDCPPAIHVLLLWSYRFYNKPPKWTAFSPNCSRPSQGKVTTNKHWYIGVHYVRWCLVKCNYRMPQTTKHLPAILEMESSISISHPTLPQQSQRYVGAETLLVLDILILAHSLTIAEPAFFPNWKKSVQVGRDWPGSMNKHALN